MIQKISVVIPNCLRNKRNKRRKCIANSLGIRSSVIQINSIKSCQNKNRNKNAFPSLSSLPPSIPPLSLFFPTESNSNSKKKLDTHFVNPSFLSAHFHDSSVSVLFLSLYLSLFLGLCHCPALFRSIWWLWVVVERERVDGGKIIDEADGTWVGGCKKCSDSFLLVLEARICIPACFSLFQLDFW